MPIKASGRNIMRKYLAIAGVLIIVLISVTGQSYAGLFKDDIPEGREIEDPEILNLFTPEFNFEWMKIIETEEGKRYVLIKAMKRVSRSTRDSYEKDTLQKRGITKRNIGETVTHSLVLSQLRLYKVLSEKPYVVGYSMVEGDKVGDKTKTVIRHEGKYIIVLIDRDFGKKFTPVELYPEKEAPCPEPPYVGKYPNSRNLVCRVAEGGKEYFFYYTSKEGAEHIYKYYIDKLKAHYKDIGLIFSKRDWKRADLVKDYGMEIRKLRHLFIDELGKSLEHKKEMEQIKSPPPSGGMVSQIVIFRVGLLPVVDNYSVIKIIYKTDQKEINDGIERMKNRDEWFKNRYPERREQ
jgi:hypothetical protein